jgi:hypothetical protein
VSRATPTGPPPSAKDENQSAKALGLGDGLDREADFAAALLTKATGSSALRTDMLYARRRMLSDARTTLSRVMSSE